MDFQNLPMDPRFVLSVALYGAISAFITGPELTIREIDNSDWSTVCEHALLAELESNRAPAEVIPTVPDVGDLIRGISPELAPLFDMIPDPSAAARETARRAALAEDARIARAAEGITDRCSCAVAVYAAEERVGIALWAASARIVKTSAVADRKIGLARALHGPACQFDGGV